MHSKNYEKVIKAQAKRRRRAAIRHAKRTGEITQCHPDHDRTKGRRYGGEYDPQRAATAGGTDKHARHIDEMPVSRSDILLGVFMVITWATLVVLVMQRGA